MSALDRLMPDTVPPLMTLERLDAWLVEQEDELAADLVAAADELLAPRVDRYVSSLTAAGDPATLDGLMTEWVATVDEAVAGKLAETWLAAATVSMVTSPAFGKIDEQAWVDVVNARAIAYQADAVNRIVGASESMWSDVRDRVVMNLDAGMAVPKLRAEVEAITGYTRGRAEAIARTETLGAYNGGDWDGTMALPPEFRPTHKTWLATGDRRTRPTHQEANGQVVPIDEPFTVGGVSMMRPHALGAPASEVVNCRCVMQMTWDEDAELPVDAVTPVEVDDRAASLSSRSRVAADLGSVALRSSADDVAVARASLDDMADLMGDEWLADEGVRFTRFALDEDEVFVAVTDGLGVNGALGGRVAAADEVGNAASFYVEYVGSTGVTSGAGSQLAREAILRADRDGLGILLEPSSPSAEAFWRSVGMVPDPYGTGSFLFGMTPAEVARVARIIE